MREDVGSGKSIQRRECQTNKRRLWLGMIFWSEAHLDCLLWSSNLLEQTGGCRTYSIILFETRQRFTGVHVHDRLLRLSSEGMGMVAKALLSCGEANFADGWRLSTNGEGRPNIILGA